MNTRTVFLNAVFVLAGSVTILAGCGSTSVLTEKENCLHENQFGTGTESVVFNLNDENPELTFTLIPSVEKDSPASVQSIVVTKPGSRCVVQTIDVSESELLSLSGSEIDTIDMDFDGMNDFRYPLFLTAGPNTPHSHWLYDAQTQLFVRSTVLDNLAVAEFDAESKTVTNNWRDGQRYGTDIYELQDKRYVLVESMFIERASQGQCKRVSKNLMTGSIEEKVQVCE